MTCCCGCWSCSRFTTCCGRCGCACGCWCDCGCGACNWFCSFCCFCFWSSGCGRGCGNCCCTRNCGNGCGDCCCCCCHCRGCSCGCTCGVCCCGGSCGRCFCCCCNRSNCNDPTLCATVEAVPPEDPALEATPSQREAATSSAAGVNAPPATSACPAPPALPTWPAPPTGSMGPSRLELRASCNSSSCNRRPPDSATASRTASQGHVGEGWAGESVPVPTKTSHREAGAGELQGNGIGGGVESVRRSAQLSSALAHMSESAINAGSEHSAGMCGDNSASKLCHGEGAPPEVPDLLDLFAA
mmetsp:Transcript_46404/g.130693  ORF Transcript_46404/g.130693 Transcript_46404/m.130693 type:complete len:300 (+) Transcript_46404:1118-2017(+)